MTNNNENFYFWLGADGELVDLENEETLTKRVEKFAEDRHAWLNVITDGDNDGE